MAIRKSISKTVETKLLLLCRRRCCLCFYLHNRGDVRRGQIAHLNHDPSDGTVENLVYLCLDHHDEFDSATSQSKGLTSGEVSHFRDQLHQHFAQIDERVSVPLEMEDAEAERTSGLLQLEASTPYAQLLTKNKHLGALLSKPWNFAVLGVTANQPEYFAYKTWNGCDGVCLIERIDLPDGRIVIACIETLGNPGQSITNAVEELAFQVCDRLAIPPHLLVWLEHYDIADDISEEWQWVRFKKVPPEGAFEGPIWVEMTKADWANLRLAPRKRLRACYSGYQYQSKLRKYFEWPPA